MKEVGTLTEAGKRIVRLERDLHEAIKVRNMLVILGKVTVEEFAELESLVRNMSPDDTRADAIDTSSKHVDKKGFSVDGDGKS